MSQEDAAKLEAHWSKTRTLMIVVMVIWFIFSFVVHWFAKDLNGSSFLGFPLGYYMAAQGSLAIFVILIAFSNWRQNQIDREFGFEEDE